MSVELDRLRQRFGHFLLLLLWAHVPVLAVVAHINGYSPLGTAAAAAFLAGAYHLQWARAGIAPATRYLSAVALMGEPALLLLLLRGHAWQMDVHMYFFAMLALTIAWCDRRAILVGAVVTALHHLVLLYLLPYAVFPGEANLDRVLLHAGIVGFQAAVLIWFSDMLVESFTRIEIMRAEILAKNEALEDRTREAEKANRAKSLFLANMSHEIRTPMNAILGFCHLIGRTELSGRQQDYIAKINGAGVSLLRLINDILDFSKNEAGRLTLESRPFNPRLAIENQITLLAVEAQARGVTIDLVTAPNVPTVVTGDELRFNQVVVNLLSNAVKFSDQGDVTIGVQALPLQPGQDEERVRLEVFVRDTGIGMNAQQQASLFKSFSQADNSTTRRFGGTGLGLYICRQIVEQMDGDIRVESAPGMGSTFTFHVTLGLPGTQDVLGAELLPSLRGLRTLAADDNPASRQIMEEIFANWQMPLDLVASGQEALGALDIAQAAGHPYDLVLLDWKMPGMDGMETLRAMRDRPRQGRMPITLMVTAYGAEELVSREGRAEISAFITKPLDSRKLLNALQQVMADRNRTQAPARAPDVAPQVQPHLRGLRVLLVEDNEINGEIATSLLIDAGLLVDTAANGRVACALVAERGASYAGVLMDVQMPEMDGLEATRHIRQAWSARALPIIAMTAHAYEEERQRCIEAGMNDHIAKPVDPQGLVSTLNRWLVVPGPAGRTPAARGSGFARVEAPAAPVPVAARKAPPQEGLPDTLPPFDIPAALARVNGKRVLLRKLIQGFGVQYARVGADLRDLLAEGAQADAQRVAHTLKGVAGSLELPQVLALAARIEQALGEGHVAQARAEIDELEEVIAPALRAAQGLAPMVVEEGPVPTPAADAPGVVEAVAQLRALLVRRSLRARAAFVVLADAQRLSATERAAHPLHRALEALNYEAALAVLDGGDKVTQPEGTLR